jgi:hypothetical protein
MLTLRRARLWPCIWLVGTVVVVMNVCATVLSLLV